MRNIIKMSFKRINWGFHLTIWLLLVIVPSLISPGPPQGIERINAYLWLLPILGRGIIVLFVFYLNYLYLIPNYLFKGFYNTYIVSSIVLVLILIFIPFFIESFLIVPPFPIKGIPTGTKGATIRPATIFFESQFLTIIAAHLAAIGLSLKNRWEFTEKEKLAAELSYLRTQINPHFLFNTLNGIYSMTIDKAPQAAEMVDKLAEMMRYTLKEAHFEYIPLNDEINHITNYIELQKLRFDKSVKLTFNYKGNFLEHQIAPLLLIPFIENAFKHGVNSEQESEIIIQIDMLNDDLKLFVYNKKVEVDKLFNEKSGLGIINTQSRLNLIYFQKHTLTIIDIADNYSILLKIKLK